MFIIAGEQTYTMLKLASKRPKKHALAIILEYSAQKADMAHTIYEASGLVEGQIVPSSHDAMYFFCSGVSLSICMFIDSSFSLATAPSISEGTL